MSQPFFYFKQIEIGPMQNFMYLVGDSKTKECFIVDPAWDVEEVMRIAEVDGMKIIGALSTHTHFDHINGAEYFIEKTNKKIYIHKKEANFLKKIKDHIKEVDSGSRIKVGNFEVTCIHTPGHTTGSQCFLIEGHLLSGDTLFVNACGRCDLEGSNISDMYDSLKKLSELPDETIVFPGHHYGPDLFSCIGKEKRNNPYFKPQSSGEFKTFRIG